MNKVIIIGNLIRDAELKATTSGTEVCTFTLGVNRNYKNAEGKYDSDFINCIAYKKYAELIKTYTKKGDKLAIEGRIQTRNYEKDGKKIYVTEIIVESVQFLVPKQKSETKTSYTAEEIDELPW